MTNSYIFDETFVADGIVAANRIVVAGQAGDFNSKHAKLPAGQDAAAILGVTLNATTASGDTVLVRRAGIANVEVASGNVTVGAPLRASDIRGFADVQTAAWLSGDGVLGYAEQASSASGDVIECWLAIRTLLA